jgi:three-Cys-motif partner protein
VDSSKQPIQPWTKDKLALLARYLSAYSRIMSKQKTTWLRKYSYIDAFASLGMYLDRDTRDLVNGSPLVALECEPPFDEYWFIELAADRLEYLKSIVPNLKTSDRCRFIQGDANNVLSQRLCREITRHTYQRGLIFLDPYGLQVEWQTICSLSEAKAFDVFFNFPIMGVNRILDRRHRPPRPRLNLLERVMGETSWIDRLYLSQVDLFGEEHSRRERITAEALAKMCIGNIGQLFEYVSTPVIMRNSSNAPLYALFLASHNQTAVKITNDIFKRYERLRR